MPPLGTPLANSKFTLNTAGVAGFFGGEEVLSAIGIAHLYEGRRWLGWYNSPGSYVIAKHFGRLSPSPFWLFPGPHESPAVVFGLDVKKGPTYIAAFSGTTVHTGHLGYLTMERIKEVEAERLEGRQTRPIDVGYLVMKHVDSVGPIRRLPLRNISLALLPTIVSMVTCVMCALVHDWFSFSMISLGIISTGLASLVIGGGRLVIQYNRFTAPGVPPGHGILLGKDGVMVIKGKERDVNVITQGRFDLVEDTHHMDDVESTTTAPKYRAIGISCFLLLVQFFLQLLLIPQGTLFGQIMFLVSLYIAWLYNTQLSSLVKERLQTEILFRAIGNPEMVRFRIGTRTTMVVFVCLLLFHGVEHSSEQRDRELRFRILHECIPNDTVVWRRWKEKVTQQLLNVDDGSGSLPYLMADEEDRALPDPDRKLLETLLKDADTAFRGYFGVRDRLADDSSHQKD